MEITLVEASKALGTSVPRVTRALKRLGVLAPKVSRDHRVARVIDASMFAILERDLGFAPHVDGYTREELFVLAALNWSPYGFRSTHALSRAARISATTASKVVTRLTSTGLIVTSPQQELFNRMVRTVSALHLNRHHSEWQRLSEQVSTVKLPVGTFSCAQNRPSTILASVLERGSSQASH